MRKQRDRRRRVIVTLELETDKTIRELKKTRYAALGLDSHSVLFDGTVIQAQVSLVKPEEEAI